MTIDVEDYFQVSAFADIVSFKDWDIMEQRVQSNTGAILEILRHYNVQATFFVVGWIAEKYPELVRTIMADGHEIGCHSYWHRKIYELTPEEFKKDTLKAKAVLERICQKDITAYRAPSFSITRKSWWALEILKETGFRVDSSIYPITHDLYGIPDSPRFHYELIGHAIHEYPISTAVFFGKKLPIAGGGYFRLFPYWLTKAALKRINGKELQPFVFYLHPWEIDFEQPRFSQAKLLSKVRHYNNLDKTMKRFKRLLNDFNFVPLPTAQ